MSLFVILVVVDSNDYQDSGGISSVVNSSALNSNGLGLGRMNDYPNIDRISSATNRKLETYISRAEIAWKSGKVTIAVRWAQRALEICECESKKTALKIFIARAYSQLGRFKESNEVYRSLLRSSVLGINATPNSSSPCGATISQKVYLPPVISGLLYNNFKTQSTEKMHNNVRLMKIFLKES